MKTVDATGTVVNGYTYDVYGKKASSTGSQANEFDFAGQQTDATGLQYLRARYYDPATGAFLSRDPMAASPGWGGNSYAYASGNPVNASDPSGLAPFWNEATQRTEDDAQPGIFWNSATQGWQDIGSGATWSDAGGWSAAAPYVFQGPVVEPAPSAAANSDCLCTTVPSPDIVSYLPMAPAATFGPTAPGPVFAPGRMPFQRPWEVAAASPTCRFGPLPEMVFPGECRGKTVLAGAMEQCASGALTGAISGFITKGGPRGALIVALGNCIGKGLGFGLAEINDW